MQFTEEDRVALAVVSGVLETFAKLNSFGDCQAAFSVEMLPKGARDNKWIEVPDWESELRRIIRAYALIFLREQGLFPLAEDYLFDRLATFLAPVTVWKPVLLSPKYDWECSFVDLLFEREDRAFALHFGEGD